MVVKKDITKLKHKQETFLPAVFYISSLPAFRRFDEISGSRSILTSLKVISKYSVLPAAEDSPLFVKNPP